MSHEKDESTVSVLNSLLYTDVHEQDLIVKLESSGRKKKYILLPIDLFNCRNKFLVFVVLFFVTKNELKMLDGSITFMLLWSLNWHPFT